MSNLSETEAEKNYYNMGEQNNHSQNWERGVEVKIARNGNVYPKDLKKVLAVCLKEEIFTDVTLYCRRTCRCLSEKSSNWVGVKANLSVLAAASPFIRRIVNHTKLMDYCIVMDGYSYEEVSTLINYAYTGVVHSQIEIVNLKQLVETFELGMSVTEGSDDLPSSADEDHVGWNQVPIQTEFGQQNESGETDFEDSKSETAFQNSSLYNMEFENQEGSSQPSKKLKLSKRDATYDKLPADFQIPTSFNQQLDRKLARNEESLSSSEYNTIAREIGHAIKLHTYFPKKDELVAVCQQLIEKFPVCLFRHEGPEVFIPFMCTTISRVMERLRANKRGESKGTVGRPRKAKQLFSPGTAPNFSLDSIEPSLPSTSERFDEASYLTNANRMKELFQLQNPADQEEIELLLKLTHEGRQRQIKLMDTPTVIQHFAFLTQSCYLLAEFDLLAAADPLLPIIGISSKLKQRWIQVVPAVLLLATTSNKQRVREILQRTQYHNMNNDFEQQSRCALELLPLFLIGQIKDAHSAKYFFDYREQSTDLLTACSSIPDRKTPFILAIGEDLYIIVEGQPLIYTGRNSTEALVLLMATYYVFDIVYSKNVKPTLLFIQTCLGKPDDDCKKCRPLAIFLNLIAYDNIVDNQS